MNGHLIWVNNRQKLEWLRRQFNNDSNGFWLGGKQQIYGHLKWEPNGTKFQLKDFGLVERGRTGKNGKFETD